MNVNIGAVAESVVCLNPSPAAGVCVPPWMFISHTVVDSGSAFVRVSVTVGFAAVVVPVVIVQEQVCPFPATVVTVAVPVDCQPALNASSAFVQAEPWSAITYCCSIAVF